LALIIPLYLIKSIIDLMNLHISRYNQIIL